MVDPVKVAEVYYNDLPVGRIALAPDRRSVFEYDRKWLENGFSISPVFLPLRTGAFTSRAEPFDGLFGVFADSLPDGWSNLLIDRWLMTQGIIFGTNRC
ncbi:MAG: HipA N-terminal domain-containing protein [Bacteroidetes bacterium]|nr:HipA N-terminal domain-containing protein [Bacteroidota bacterium]